MRITAATSIEEIEARLQELENEWDIERTLEANAAVFSLTGLALGFTVSKKWLMLPAIVAGFLLQHALQGWCPPVSLFRGLEIRTEPEISAERTAMKLPRGDFKNGSADRFRNVSHLVEAAAR